MTARETRTVLVCGGRDYQNYAVLREHLDAQRSGDSIAVVQGGSRGADAMARQWAETEGQVCITVPADWRKHGRVAGPIRNTKMLADYPPDIVIAFPGGKGTADTVRKAKAAGVEIIEVIE